METLLKYDTTILYSINKDFFKDNREVVTSYSTRSHWRRAEKNTFILDYRVTFSAHDQLKSASFIRYERDLMLHCEIDDIKSDAVQIIELKSRMHRSLENFIEQNSLGYFEKLTLKPVVLSEDQVAREIEQFGFLKYKNKFENQTKEDKELENWLGYQQLKIDIK